MRIIAGPRALPVVRKEEQGRRRGRRVERDLRGMRPLRSQVEDQVLAALASACFTVRQIRRGGFLDFGRNVSHSTFVTMLRTDGSFAKPYPASWHLFRTWWPG